MYFVSILASTWRMDSMAARQPLKVSTSLLNGVGFSVAPHVCHHAEKDVVSYLTAACRRSMHCTPPGAAHVR